ncbi:MAG: hypothetical protein OEZ20_08130 [candidate division WOR-3 bacterium]|nr:hypothetical protein [candidate division WOR-3 bacterium]
MKGILILLVGIILCFAQPPPEFDEPPLQERRAPRELIETLRKVRLIEELKLTEEQSIKFFPRVNEMKEAKQAFNQKRRDLIVELADLLEKSPKSPKEIETKLDELFKLEEDFNKKETALKKEIRKILTPEQEVRLLLFQIRFDQEMREMIRGIRGWRQEQRKQERKPRRR